MSDIKDKNYISFSEYSLYRSCLYKWYVSYVLRESSQENEFLVFGKALHATLETIVKKSPNRMLYTRIFEDKLKENSNGILLNSYFGKGMTRDATELISKLNYFDRFADWRPLVDKDNNVVSLEEELFEPVTEVNGTKLYFKGLVDYSAKHLKEDKYIVLDWKTGLKPWDLNKKLGHLKFEDYSHKLDSGYSLLSLEELEDLQTKIFFGQTVLYKHFYSLKHNIDIDKIKIRYCVLTRQPVEVVEYEVEIQDSFTQFILEDFKRALEEIYKLKQMKPEEVLEYIKKNKVIHKKSIDMVCKYCDLKKRC